MHTGYSRLTVSYFGWHAKRAKVKTSPHPESPTGGESAVSGNLGTVYPFETPRPLDIE